MNTFDTFPISTCFQRIYELEIPTDATNRDEKFLGRTRIVDV